MRALIDGVACEPEDATISVFDWGLQRGDGCFEMIRSYDGVPFAVEAHLDRLERSAAIMELTLPPRDDIAGWIAAMAAAGGNCAVRVMITRGGVDPLFEAPPRCIVLWEPVPFAVGSIRLYPLVAPWHAAGRASELTGAKTLSYGPNVAASRAAQAAGFDDALLISPDGLVLEGPTFSVGWFHDGALETPTLELDVLESITRRETLALADGLGIPIDEGRFSLDRVLSADEVFAISTIKEVTAVEAIGDEAFEPGPLTAKLASSLAVRIES